MIGEIINLYISIGWQVDAFLAGLRYFEEIVKQIFP